MLQGRQVCPVSAMPDSRTGGPRSSMALSQHAVRAAAADPAYRQAGRRPAEIAEAVLIAMLQVAIIGCLFRPLETFWPAERWSDRKLTRVDRQYTLWMLLGIFPLFSYLVLTPFANYFGGADSRPRHQRQRLDRSASPTGFPALDHHPLALFLVYYVIYDLVYYLMHRVQHALPWWWALHSMHHSQRQMSCWTNDRGSLVDGFIQSMILAVVGLADRRRADRVRLADAAGRTGAELLPHQYAD